MKNVSKMFFALMLAVGIATASGSASAKELTHGTACQNSGNGKFYYGWTDAWTQWDATAVVCPISRATSSTKTAKAFVYLSDGSSISGYLNNISQDGTTTSWGSGSASGSGNKTITFSTTALGQYSNGYINFDLSLSSFARIVGFYTSA